MMLIEELKKWKPLLFCQKKRFYLLWPFGFKPLNLIRGYPGVIDDFKVVRGWVQVHTCYDLERHIDELK